MLIRISLSDDRGSGFFTRLMPPEMNPTTSDTAIDVGEGRLWALYHCMYEMSNGGGDSGTS